jgi:hypothetical protein
MIAPKALEAAARAVADLGGFKSRTFPENIAQAALDAYHKHLAEAGLVIVPMEPTEAMLNAMHNQIRILCVPEEQVASILNDKATYRAMIAAHEGN